MITLVKYGASCNELVLFLEGLSTDTKPIEFFDVYDNNGTFITKKVIENGSKYTEIDTGKEFAYDAENETWYEDSSGGGGGVAVYNATITIQKNGTKVDDFTANQRTDKTINITVPTTAADVSALPDTTKYAAALSLTINSSTFVMTGQLKDQNGDNLGTAQTIDLPLESVVVNGSYNSQTKKVVLTLQNGNTIEFSVADLVSGLQTELSASNKLNPAYINYDSTHRAVSDTEKSTWNSKQTALDSTQLAAVNSGIDSTKVAQIETNKNNILLKQDIIDSSHKLNADLVDDSTTTNKFATAAQLQQIETNKDNITLLEQMNGKKNCFDYNSWKTVGVYNGTKTNITNGITITATDNNCFTRYEVTGTDIYPVDAQIPVTSGKKYVFMWDYTAENSQTNDTVLIFGNGDLSKNVAAYAQAEKIEYTVPNDVTFVTFRLGVATSGNSATYKDIMFVDKTVYDAGFTDYQAYSMSNAELTAAIQAIQAQLANG